MECEQSLSSIKLSRNVYTAVQKTCAIRPKTLSEWITQCDDPEAVKAYLIAEFDNGGDKNERSVTEDQNRYYIGWLLFCRRNERHCHLPKLVFSILPDYSNLVPSQQLLAEKAELDAWCKLMGI